MQDMDVRIVELEPMRVAFTRAVSSSPEKDAWATLEAWAEKNGLLDDPGKLKVFGFNNPKLFLVKVIMVMKCGLNFRKSLNLKVISA